MKAQALVRHTRLEAGSAPLEALELPEPRPTPGQVLIKVSACGVCHTELDEIEGRLPPPKLPIIPGHQVVGRVIERGVGAQRFELDERVGVAWIYSACGKCSHCRSGNENLCANFQATGRDTHGGYAEMMVVPEAFAYPIPSVFSDVEAAPLLCAGAIGLRSLRLANLIDGQTLGLVGFGASAHLVLKLARHRLPNSPVFVFSRSPQERQFAQELGAAWAGEIGATPPDWLNAVIDTTPAWKPVLAALGCLAPGGRLVINAIRKEASDRQILSELDYPAHLWMEKEIKSVANVARQDVSEFLALAAEIPIKPEVQVYPLADANQALLELKNRQIRGAKVLAT